MIKNLYDFIKIVDEYIIYLNGKIKFSHNGYPIFEKEFFLEKEPSLIIPFYHRNNKIVIDPNLTVISFYSSDEFLYRRLERVFKDLDEYERFAGVSGLDLTVTADMDLEWQDFILLANYVFDAILAVNGIKIVANIRIGGSENTKSLLSIPKNVLCSAGFLGCDKIRDEKDYSFAAKVLTIMPSHLLIYGKHDSIAEKQLSILGISYQNYRDFHQLSKEGL